MTRLSDFVEGRSMSELYDRYWVPAVLEVFARGLAARVQEGARVLDLATGTGLVAGLAAEGVGSQGEIVGLDPTPELLNAARNKHFEGASIRWAEGSGERIPFDDSEFDVVLCHQGLQYVVDREATFLEIARVLRPGGVLHAGTWSSAFAQTAFGFVEDELAACFGAEQKPVHAWSFGGLPELRRLAEAAGLKVERLETIEGPMRFDSIQQFVDVQIACAGRTTDEGQLAMGLVDLEDERWLPAIERFSATAHEELAAYANASGLSAPFLSDELTARA